MILPCSCSGNLRCWIVWSVLLLLILGVWLVLHCFPVERMLLRR